MFSKKPNLWQKLPPGEAESASAAAAADDLLKPPPAKAEDASSPSKSPLQAGEGGPQTNKPGPEAKPRTGSDRDPDRDPVTLLPPKVGQLSCKKPNVPGENVVFTASLAATTTTMLETVNHLSTQLTRLVALLQGNASAVSTSHAIAILNSMERALWTHSSPSGLSQGLLNNVQRLKEECYEEARRAYKEASEGARPVIIGSGGDI